MSRKIIQIVDSLEYIRKNCFQHQLYETLKRETDLSIIQQGEFERIHEFEGDVLICLKLRTLDKTLHSLSTHLKDRKVYVYEQDPWECFGDDAACPGSYDRVCKQINVQAFLTPSKWWSDFINSKGLPSKFVKMWVLPEYCSTGLSSAQRMTPLGLMGQIHPWRKIGLDALKGLGQEVSVIPARSDYLGYLQTVGTMISFLHDEPPHFKIDWETIPCNSMWGKEVEVMSQGTFCFRNREEEADAYGLRNNPLLLEFSTYEEIIEKLMYIKSLSYEQRDKMIEEGVRMIKEDTGWKTVIHAMQ